MLQQHTTISKSILVQALKTSISLYKKAEEKRKNPYFDQDICKNDNIY